MLAPALLSAVSLSAAQTPPPGFTDLMTYRLWPKTGKADTIGLTNVDSGNAPGDALFGLSNLLLPQLCAEEPSFLWCENRGSLSGGEQWMVYTEYAVEAKQFGEYAACNPCNNTVSGGGGGMAPPKCPTNPDGTTAPDGTFVCQGYGQPSGPPPPPQCQKGFEIFHQDCYNGTIFKTLQQASEGDCCAACTAAGETCAAWNMPAGYNGTVCQLMKKPLVMWNEGQYKSKCKAAEVSRGGGGGRECWYSNPKYNETFAAYCDKSECSCEAINVQAMGREDGAMCHDGRRRRRLLAELTDAPPPPPVGPPDGFWKCTAELQNVCPFDRYRSDPSGCLSCASSNSAALQEAGCDQSALDHGCNGDYEKCFQVFDSLCPKARYGGQDKCEACAYTPAHTPALEAANCTQFFLDYECGGGGGHHHRSNPWESYISALGCHLNGTWFSTREEGECKPGATASDPSCWWRIAETKRTVNQSCVDGNVIAAVEKIRPDCFAKCPQPTNQSSACYLHCFFDTMVGNDTLHVSPMPAADIIKHFTASFATADPSQGGCPSV